MMVVGQTPFVVPLRARATPQIDNSRIALTKRQISEIAHIFDPTVEDELAKARIAWTEYPSTRRRDGIYRYLTAVFEIVARWKKEHRAKSSSHQALAASKSTKAIKSKEPFAVVIYCTSDPCKVDAKTRNKWARALRYAGRLKPDNQGLADFIKSKGGINESAAQWSGHLR